MVYFTLAPNGRAMRQALIGETALRLDQVSYQFVSHGSPVQLSFLAEPATGRFELLAFDWRAEDTQARLRRIQ